MTRSIFTIQHNEKFYLPMWIKYYSKAFKPEDMYILSHNCSGETLEILKDAETRGINVEYLETDEIFNHEWLTKLVQDTQIRLLKKYKYVVFTDCDEFIVPRKTTLKDFLDKMTGIAYRCSGCNALEDKVYPDHQWYDKTLITSVPLTYVYGYHTSIPEFKVDEDLLLIHIHRINYQEAWERNLRLAQEKWDSAAIAKNDGTQNRINEKDKFDEWFYKDKGVAHQLDAYDELRKQL